MDVEIELQIPTLIMNNGDEAQRKVDNRHVRFRTVIQVPAFPPPGSTLHLTAGSDLAFECMTGRSDWHEGKQRFVICCKYPKHRINQNEYKALLNDPAWQKTTLLPDAGNHKAEG